MSLFLNICDPSWLKKLKTLNLHINELIQLPSAISSLENLEEMNLSLNYTLNFDTAIPKIEKLTKLKKLNISFNIIYEDQLKRLTNNMPGCKITYKALSELDLN